jgi:predicted nucleic acid-binding protein
VIFVDTGAWFAAFVPNDPDHVAAERWLADNREPLITTDYVLDELFTLLKARGEMERMIRLGRSFLEGQVAQLEWIAPSDVHQAWLAFEQFRDAGWSFTDCTSRIVMQRMSISTAFAFDEHFRQFGGVIVVP